MVALLWDQVGERLYETGVDKGVLYIPTNGIYDAGHAWNGLITVSEAPTGAETTALYADNTKYLNLISVEEFGGTIEAYTYPDEFGVCDGTSQPYPGVSVGQQPRKTFGLAYRTILGNDVSLNEFGYKLHLVWGALASPSEKSFSSVNDSPEAITFSWEFTTTPVPVTGLKPTSMMVIDSTRVGATGLAALNNALFGTAGTDPRLPLPDEVIAMFSGSLTTVTPTSPTFVAGTGVITIPTVTGVTYRRTDTNAVVTGTVTIAVSGATLGIRAFPSTGVYVLNPAVDNDWTFTRT